jgi:hypothetical protein
MKEPTSFGYFKKKSETKNWQSSWENEPLVLSISMSFEIFCQVSSRSGYHENFILWVGSLGWVFHNLTSVDYMWRYIYIYIYIYIYKRIFNSHLFWLNSHPFFAHLIICRLNLSVSVPPPYVHLT